MSLVPGLQVFWLIKIIWGHIQSNIQIICFDNSILIPGSWILLEKLLHRQKQLFSKRLLHRSLKDVCRIGEIMFQTEQKDKCLIVDNKNATRQNQQCGCAASEDSDQPGRTVILLVLSCCGSILSFVDSARIERWTAREFMISQCHKMWFKAVTTNM